MELIDRWELAEDHLLTLTQALVTGNVHAEIGIGLAAMNATNAWRHIRQEAL